MGNHLDLRAFCSPSGESQAVPLTAELRQRDAESTTRSTDNKAYSTLEEEKNILNHMVLELTQKLAVQQMENKLLKQELHTLNEQNRQNIEDITHKEDVIESLQIQLSVPKDELHVDTAPPGVYSATTRSVQSENVFADPLLQEPTSPDSLYYAKSVPTPGGESHSNKKVVISADQITANRVQHTLQTAATVRDVSKFVTRKYKTVEFQSEDEEESISQVADQEVPFAYEDDDDSSVDPEERLKINEAKELLMKGKSIDDELLAVQQEMNAMRQTISDEDILRGSVVTTEDEIYIPSTKAQNNDEDALDLPSSNLFRFESKNDWDNSAITAHKKDMQAAMAHLVQHHVNASGTHAPSSD